MSYLPKTMKQKYTLVAALFYVMSALFCADPALSQVNILSEKSEIAFSVQAGNIECKALIAINQTKEPITIKKIERKGLPKAIELTDSIHLPRIISPGESITVAYLCYRPKSKDDSYSGDLEIITLPRSDRKIPVHASVFIEDRTPLVYPTAPGAVLDFDPAEKNGGTLISMVGTDFQFIREYSFKNTSSTSYTITWVDFAKEDPNFDVTATGPGEYLPMEVAPGETFFVRLSYNCTEREPNENTLRIFTLQKNEPMNYDVRGLALPLSQMDWNQPKVAEEH